jgi:hypothetical protein
VEQLIGSLDPEFASVTDATCAACCRSFLPDAERLNHPFASHLLRVALRIADLGGVPGCSAKGAKELAGFARRHLPFVFIDQDGPPLQIPPFQRNCFQLGEALPEEASAGSGTEARFACHHERVRQTTLTYCRSCHYYDPGLLKGSAIRSWAVGVLTAPRESPTLERTLASLGAAGWPDVRVFAEPGAAVPVTVPEPSITRRSEKVLAWPNFLLGLWELLLRHPRADAYLMCEDDVVFCRGLRAYLEAEMWPAPRLGVVSLFASSAQEVRSHRSFYPVDYGRATWGAQALVFPNAAARAFVRHPEVVNHRDRGVMRGENHTDAVVGQWCRQAALSYYLHTPSLAQHIGDTSALWDDTTLAGRRVAATFPGENVDIRKQMRVMPKDEPEDRH